jgi:hypothetical protein
LGLEPGRCHEHCPAHLSWEDKMFGYVYLIGSSLFGWYKIGKTKNPKVRVDDLGILLPFKIEVFAIWEAKNCGAMEKALHEKYAEFHINGEWFRFNKDKLESVIEKEIPVSARIFSKESLGTYFSSFSNIDSDAPEGKCVRIKIKNQVTPEEAENLKSMAIELRKQEKINKLCLQASALLNV